MTTRVSAAARVAAQNPLPIPAYTMVPWLAYLALYVLYLSDCWPSELGVAAVALCLFGPGFALLPALFGGKTSFDTAESLALAAPLSLAVGGIIGVALTYMPRGLELESYLGSMVIFTSLCLTISFFRRNQLGVRKVVANESAVACDPAQWKQRDMLTVALNVVLTAITLLGAVTLGYNMQRSVHGPYFTEFYLLDASGRLGDYPVSRQLAEPLELQYGVTNREATNTTYQVCIHVDEEVPSCADPITLRPSASWQSPIELEFPGSINKPTQIEFVLTREQQVYRTLHLWVYPDR